MRSVVEDTTWIPETEEDKEQVRQQMHRLLETTHFKNSRRYPALFRYMVEETLAGRGEFLKERVLGVQVFGRPADYDTAADPTVRVSVAEIRKRIAQYYHEEEHDLELRIDLQPGRYQPEFRVGKEVGPPRPRRYEDLPTAESEAEPAAEMLDQGHTLESQKSLTVSAVEVSTYASADAPQLRVRGTPRALRRTMVPIGLLLLSAAAIALIWSWLHPSPIAQLWAPLLEGRTPLVLTVAGGPKAHDAEAMRALLDNAHEQTAGAASTADPAEATTAPPTFLNHMVLDQNIVLADALAMSKVVDLLAQKHRDYHIRLSGETTLDDLRQGPSILIGGLDNSWTLRVVAPLRFRFDADNEYKCWISDRKNPQDRAWLLDLSKRYSAVNQDYAIIARVHNRQTGQPQLVVAGLGMSGTVAASEMLMNPELARQLQLRVGSGFRSRDFEAVLRTDVVNGIAGPPSILVVEVW